VNLPSSPRKVLNSTAQKKKRKEGKEKGGEDDLEISCAVVPSPRGKARHRLYVGVKKEEKVMGKRLSPCLVYFADHHGCKTGKGKREKGGR